MTEWTVETCGLAEFLDILIEILRAQRWEWAPNAAVLVDDGLCPAGDVDPDLGLGLLLTQTPSWISSKFMAWMSPNRAPV